MKYTQKVSKTKNILNILQKTMAVVYLIDEKMTALTEQMATLSSQMEDQKNAQIATKQGIADETTALQQLRSCLTLEYQAQREKLAAEIVEKEKLLESCQRSIEETAAKMPEVGVILQNLMNRRGENGGVEMPELEEEIRRAEEGMAALQLAITELTEKMTQTIGELEGMRQSLSEMRIEEEISAKQQMIDGYRQALDFYAGEIARYKEELDNKTKERRSVSAMKDAYLRREKEITDRLTALEAAARRVPSAAPAQASKSSR